MKGPSRFAPTLSSTWIATPRADAADEYDAGEAVEDVLMLPGTNTLLLELPQLNRNLELGIEEPPLPGSMAEMEEAMANNPELYGPARQEEQDDEWRPSTEPSQQPSENTEQAGGRAWVDVVNTRREAATPAASGSSNGAAEAAQPRRQNNNTRPRTSSTGSRANMSLATRRQGRQHGRRQRQIYLPRGFQLPRSVARRPQRTRGGQPAMRSPNSFQALETIDEEEGDTDETATQQPQQRSGREWRPVSRPAAPPEATASTEQPATQPPAPPGPTRGVRRPASQPAARPEAAAPTQQSAAHPDTSPRTGRSVWRPVSRQRAPQPASSSVQEAPEGECEYIEGDYQ
ncbi:unnamed protein product [Vitrella brassicaformis CCMP3155]|uniref:Uncharacterized protein n=1 Tax=Vitrella brassicaformis (strain CCMP3155) TaxID=1169540 RepID=A0A0G4GEH2_VITBC|nr:unnamed protein product [Vitrella brassicaformis CCMP3155]|eukprot:CEM27772.1 unnamed protein product [Vitrella brassicaformis CCMP3155]